MYKLIITIFLSLLIISAHVSAEEINFRTIKTYAEFAKEAYGDLDSVKEFFNGKRFVMNRYQELTEMRVCYYLITDEKEKTHTIAVRGTDNVENVIVDLNLHLKRDPDLQIYLHRGFAMAAKSIYSDVRKFLKKDYRINTTGHSLGGAIAVILAMSLAKDNFTVGDVVTFGQPKVTNLSGSEKYENLKVLRVVTKLDIVPLVPPFDPKDIKNLDIFWHQGTELILLDGDEYSIATGIKSMLRAIGFFKKVPDRKNLEYHKMDTYLKKINKKIINSKRVPGKSGFEFLDIF